MFKTIVAPHFEYCESILAMANNGQFDRMQKLQNRAMRIILKCNKRTSIDSMLEALRWMNIKQKNFLQDVNFCIQNETQNATKLLNERNKLSW